MVKVRGIVFDEENDDDNDVSGCDDGIEVEK